MHEADTHWDCGLECFLNASVPMWESRIASGAVLSDDELRRGKFFVLQTTQVQDMAEVGSCHPSWV
jgi:hypothetical protein